MNVRKAPLFIAAFATAAHAESIVIASPMAPPDWALAQRALIRENVAAAVGFAAKYIDPRGHFRGVERWGGNEPATSGSLALRYVDADRRRAGAPEDVAALVDSLEDGRGAVTLVNVNQTEERTTVVQAGAYGEHTVTEVQTAGRTFPRERQ
jgi:hypothetical protein